MMLEVKRIKELRKSKRCYQKDVAAVLGVTERHYRLCESGGVDLPTSKLVSLAEYFGVSLDYLVGRTEKPEVNI